MHAGRGTTNSRPLADRVLLYAAVMLGCVPVVVAAAAAHLDDYSAWGDQAILAMRAGDIFTLNTPLLGMPTGGWAGIATNHPGPLLFWVLAPFVRVFGNSTGPLVAVAALGVASIIGIAMVARRHTSERGAAALTALAAMAYMLTGGVNLLYRPVNPIAVFLPFMLFLVLSWAVSNGDKPLRPLWALVGSLVVQSELAFVPVTATMALVTLALARHGTRGERNRFGRRFDDMSFQVRAAVERNRSDPRTLIIGTRVVCVWASAALATAFTDSVRIEALIAGATALGATIVLAGPIWSMARRRRPSPTVVVLLVVWALPVLQQLLSPNGNVTALAKIGRSPSGTLGWTGARAALDAIAGSPLRFLWSDFDASLEYSTPAAVAILSVGLFVGVTLWAHRNGHTDLARLGLFAGAALVASAYAAANLRAGDFASTHVLWLIPIAALFWTVVVVGVATIVGSGRLRPVAATAFLGLAVFVTVPRLVDPGQLPIADTEYHAWMNRATPEIAADLRRDLPPGHLRVLVAGGGPVWLKQLSIGLMADLETGPVDVATYNIVNYLGSARNVFDDEGVDASIWVMDEPVTVPPRGAVRLFRYEPDGWDPDTVTDLAADIAGAVDRSSGLVLTEDEDNGGLRRVLFGRRPYICPAEVSERIPCDHDATTGIDLDSLDDRTILDLYRAEIVESPQLDGDLRTRLRDDASALPVSVWIGPAPGSSELDQRFD